MSKRQAEKHDGIFNAARKKKMVRDIAKTLKQRGLVIERTLKDIKEIGRGLEKERDVILDSIDKSIQEIRDAVNEVVENIHKKMDERHHMNLEILHENETILMDKLKICKQDMTKCEDILKDSVPSGELKVNKVKVLDMVIASVEKNKFILPATELNRMTIDKDGVNNDVKQSIKMLIGKVAHRTETLGEIKNPVTLLKSMPITNSEVNALALSAFSGKAKPWICSGVGNEIVNYSEYGVREKTISTDFEVNDIVVSEDNRIFATSPDSHHVRCLKLTQSGGFVQMFAVKDALHLQGVTLCRNKRTFAVCGTDRPNYSTQPPNEVVIVEYSYDGKEIKRLAISNFTGKVYRHTQNVNGNYVLTFPKEGMVLSVDNSTGEIRNFFDNTDFRLFASTHLKQVKSADFWPTGVCCDKNGSIFVTEYLEKLLLMLDSDCTPLRTIGGRFKCPNAVCFHETSSSVWLADKGKLHVWKIENVFQTV